MPKNGRLDWKAAVFAMDGCVQLSSSCCSGQSIPRTTEAAKLFVFGEKLTFGGANPQNGAFMMRRKFLDFGWFQPIVMFWVEWDSLISTGVAWRTHNSCVHLENLYQKSDKLKQHKFPTKRRKFPTKRLKLFLLFSMHIWTLRCYIPAHVPQSVWISKKCEKCKNGSWHGKNPAKQLERKFLAETAEITEATIIALAGAGGRNFTKPAGLGIYIYIINLGFRFTKFFRFFG